jgi:hypothetical protein
MIPPFVRLLLTGYLVVLRRYTREAQTAALIGQGGLAAPDLAD